MKRILFKVIIGSFAFVLLVLALEFGWFYSVLLKVPKSDGADLIVVFDGAHERIINGYALANQELAPFMTVSPASVERLKNLDKTYRSASRYQYLVEERALTTYQNAWWVAQLIRSHKLQSVLLVTDSYHMPRSYMLLKLQLMGSGVVVRPRPVEGGCFGRNPLAWSGLQKKRVYNEMVELWGSAAEMVHHFLTGRLQEKGLKRNQVVMLLRSVLLFDIKEP